MKFSKQQIFDLIKMFLAFAIVQFAPDNVPANELQVVLNWVIAAVLGIDGAARTVRTTFGMDAKTMRNKIVDK